MSGFFGYNSLRISDQSAEDIEKFRERYRNDIPLFASEVLDIVLDENQTNIANAIIQNKKLAIAGGRGCGKSVVVCVIMIWWISMFKDSKVGCTSNTASQTSIVLFQKMRNILSNSAISDWFEVTQDNIKTTAGIDKLHRIIWRENCVEGVAGLHSPNLLIVFDEASSIDNGVITTLLASCTENNNKVMMISNPTRVTGYFHDCFSDPDWISYSIDCNKSKFVSKESIEAIRKKYGTDSDEYRVQVLGEFPKNNSNALFSINMLDSIVFGKVDRLSPPLVMGIDIAGTGQDQSVWSIRSGNKIKVLLQIHTPDIQYIIDNTRRLVNQWHPQTIFIDSTGIGNLVPSALKQQIPGVRAVSVNFGASADRKDCSNLRVQMYENMRDCLNDNPMYIETENREELRRAMGAIEVSIEDRTRLFRLTPKARISSIIGHSPDTLDSIALTFTEYHKGDSQIRGFSAMLNDRDKKQILREFRQKARWNPH